MTANSLIWGMLKPSLKTKFNFSEIHKVNFVADRIDNELNLTGIGLSKVTNEIEVVKSQPLILSENKTYVELFDSQVKDEFKKINKPCYLIALSILDVDFKNKKCFTEVKYFESKNSDLQTIKFNLEY